MSRFAFTAGMADVVEEPRHAVDVVQEREVERLQLQRDLQAEAGGVLAPAPGRSSTPARPLLGRRDHLALPDVLAQHEQDVPRLERVGHVEIRPDPVDVEPLDARVEVDQADRDAGDADDRQAGRGRIRP